MLLAHRSHIKIVALWSSMADAITPSFQILRLSEGSAATVTLSHLWIHRAQMLHCSPVRMHTEMRYLFAHQASCQPLQSDVGESEEQVAPHSIIERGQTVHTVVKSGPDEAHFLVHKRL